MTAATEVRKSAVLSADGRYRYHLRRTWVPLGGSLPFVMLNPSTADAELDDPTIRRCAGFARRLGYGGIWVANLYAWRATRPADLWSAHDPVGPDNDRWLRSLFSWAAAANTSVVAGWGANARDDRVREVLAMPYAVRVLHCLGITAACGWSGRGATRR